MSSKPSDPAFVSIALCSLTASAIVVDGIAKGDVEAGLVNSRHAVALSALFRARAILGKEGGKQSLVLSVSGEGSGSLEKELKGHVNTLFVAAISDAKESMTFDDAYVLQFVFDGADVRIFFQFMLSYSVPSHHPTWLSLFAAQVHGQGSSAINGETKLYLEGFAPRSK